MFYSKVAASLRKRVTERVCQKVRELDLGSCGTPGEECARAIGWSCGVE